MRLFALIYPSFCATKSPWNFARSFHSLSPGRACSRVSSGRRPLPVPCCHSLSANYTKSSNKVLFACRRWLNARYEQMNRLICLSQALCNLQRVYLFDDQRLSITIIRGRFPTTSMLRYSWCNIRRFRQIISIFRLQNLSSFHLTTAIFSNCNRPEGAEFRVRIYPVLLASETFLSVPCDGVGQVSTYLILLTRIGEATLNIVAVCSSETFICTYKSTRRYYP